MASKWNERQHTSATTGRGKKTSQGKRNVGFATMNKEKIEPMLPPRYMKHGGIEVKYTSEDYEKHDRAQR